MTLYIAQLFLFCAAISVAVAIAYSRDLLVIAIFSSVFSLLLASIFVALDAVDVAFTEAAVGAGISTLLMLATISLTTREVNATPRRAHFLASAICVIVGAAILYGIMDMPRFGDPSAPAQMHVAPDYIAHAPQDMDVPNVVTAVLASYRGHDTLGETIVIFTGFVGVMFLLGGFMRSSRRVEKK